MEDKWISVKDKLPDESTNYLVYTEQTNDRRNEKFRVSTSFFTDDRKWMIETEFYQHEGKVAYWQEVPNPPMST